MVCHNYLGEFAEMIFVSLLQEVLGSLVHRPVTESYPKGCVSCPTYLHGMLLWDAEKCIGCSLCARQCPARALEFEVIDRKEKRFVLRYHFDRCIFCSHCVYSCPKDALSMSGRYELASADKAAFDICYGEPEDVQNYLAEHADDED